METVQVIKVSAALFVAIAAIGPGIGIGLVGKGAMEAIGRNPASFNTLFVPMILGFAFAESLVIFALVAGFIFT
jgi:F-type H+-transporting ATPase subunit c